MMINAPEIPILESEEFWSQRAIDTPDIILEEIRQIKEKSIVDQPSTVTALSQTMTNENK